MVFNFTKKYQFTTGILLKNEKIEIVEQAKLLGLILTSDLKWDENTNYLVRDANKRMLMLRAAAKFTSDKQVLKQIYYSRIRCKLEQSAAVWSTSLTQKNIADLERVQKAAVRLINGKPYESYSETLKELNIMRLSERRKVICLKFAKSCLRIKNFEKLFPIHESKHRMKTRHEDKFQVSQSNGKRHANSAIPQMVKLLNKEHKEQKQHFKKLQKSFLSPTNFACTGIYC